MKIIRLILSLLLLNSLVSAYESEKRLETVITGKVAKYITWKPKSSDEFVITILNSQFGVLFDEVYIDKEIKSKPVKIHYIKNISDLNTTDILFISALHENNLEEIFSYTSGKNILLVSDIRGFAQKGGNLQFYFLGQKIKLKMNIDVMTKEGFHVERTLLKIVDIVKGDK